MPFEIAGPRSSVLIEDADERLLSHLPRELGLRTPQCDMLWQDFYASPKLTSPEQVAQLKAELLAIRAAYEQTLRAKLLREKKIHAKSPAVVESILAPMLAIDPVLAKCNEIVRVCDEAVSEGRGLDCHSD